MRSAEHDAIAMAEKENYELREALARVEAELHAVHDMVTMLEEHEWAEHAGKGPISKGLEYCITTMHNELHEANELAETAQAQLAEAVGLLKHVKDWFGWGDLPESLSKLDAFLARHTQAEQQEAQGAQAGYETNIQAYERGWDDRAALATQPAVHHREPVEATEWRIDTSCGRPILTFKGCSVIEAEDAEFVLLAVKNALAKHLKTFPANPVDWPLELGAAEFVRQQKEYPDADITDFMHDALYEMLRELTNQPAMRGAEDE